MIFYHCIDFQVHSNGLQHNLFITNTLSFINKIDFHKKF